MTYDKPNFPSPPSVAAAEPAPATKFCVKCQQEKPVTAFRHLKSGKKNGKLYAQCRSCENIRVRNRSNWKSATPEYKAWESMIRRCYNPKDNSFHNYGARGIKVCDRWRSSFAHFFADMSKRPTPQHSLDRKNNNGNYEPTNCQWATKTQQTRNRRNMRISPRQKMFSAFIVGVLS